MWSELLGKKCQAKLELLDIYGRGKISEALCKLCLHFICRIVFVFMAFTIVYKFCGDVNCYIRNIFVHSCVNVCVEVKKV